MRKLNLSVLILIALTLACGCSSSNDKSAGKTSAKNSAQNDAKRSKKPTTKNDSTSTDIQKQKTSDKDDGKSMPDGKEKPVAKKADKTVAKASPSSIVTKLQGKWEIVEANLNGQAIDAMKGGIAEIKDTTIEIASGGRSMKSTMTFDEAKNPIQFESASASGQKAKAILKFDGDQLVVVTSLAPGGEHPKSFEPGQGLMVVKYKKK